MDRQSRETWAKRVERWKDSGLTAKEYASEVGINPQSLSWWKWHLSSTGAATPKTPRTRRRPRNATPDTRSPVTFVELPAPAAAEPFEVVLPSSVRVRVPSGFDGAALRRLLDVLGTRP